MLDDGTIKVWRSRRTPSRRTNTIVDDPVMAKTVQTSTISPYHFGVHLGGISFGPIKRFHDCENLEDIVSFEISFFTESLAEELGFE